MISDEPEVTPDAESCGIANDFAMRKLVSYVFLTVVSNSHLIVLSFQVSTVGFYAT